MINYKIKNKILKLSNYLKSVNLKKSSNDLVNLLNDSTSPKENEHSKWKDAWGISETDNHGVQGQVDEKYVYKHIVEPNTWQEYLSKTPDDKSTGSKVQPEDIKEAYEAWAKKFGYDKKYSTFKDLYKKRLTTAPSTDIVDGIILPSKYLEILKSEVSLGRSNLSTNPDSIPKSIGFKETGEYTLPYFSFNSTPCESCASLAVKESKEKWDNGNISEKDPQAAPMILKYFNFTSENNSREKNIGRWPGEKAVKERDAKGNPTNWWHWSAAYISWVMAKYDGEGAKWFVSESHGSYLRDAKSMRRKIEKNPGKYIGKMFYVYFTKNELDKYGMKPEPGDIVGRSSHMDIYVGGGEVIGGNACAKNSHTGGRAKNCKGTSGAQPLKWNSGAGIIKRVKITGSGTKNYMETK